MNEKTERNLKLVADRESGLTWRKIAFKYHLTEDRCRTIYQFVKGKYGGEIYGKNK